MALSIKHLLRKLFGNSSKSLPLKKRIAIVAIFKNERDYILEWVAYHKYVLGICDFIIADNISNDGSSQLLEALDQAKIIKRIVFPRTSESVSPQIPAYTHIIDTYRDQYDYFLFIDADEFLVKTSKKPLDELIIEMEADLSFGGFALNWRIFGSNNNTYRQTGLVVERFYRASAKNSPVNRHIKSLVSTKALESMEIHHATLRTGYSLFDENGKAAEFIQHPDNPVILPVGKTSPFTHRINNSALYVAHFAVKSRDEHFTKKAARGSAAGSATRKKGEIYFSDHDLNHEECLDIKQKNTQIVDGIEDIKATLKKTTLHYTFNHVHLDNQQDKLAGWIATDAEITPSITVLLDNQREYVLPLNQLRQDVVDHGITTNPLCGFDYKWIDIGHYEQSLKAWITGSNFVFLDISN